MLSRCYVALLFYHNTAWNTADVYCLYSGWWRKWSRNALASSCRVRTCTWLPPSRTSSRCLSASWEEKTRRRSWSSTMWALTYVLYLRLLSLISHLKVSDSLLPGQDPFILLPNQIFFISHCIRRYVSCWLMSDRCTVAAILHSGNQRSEQHDSENAIPVLHQWPVWGCREWENLQYHQPYWWNGESHTPVCDPCTNAHTNLNL